MTAPAQDNGRQLDLSDEDKAAAFEELFLDEVESCCSANIACCDNCHDDFVAQWPYAYSADEAKFQCESIPISWFHSATRLSDWYTKEEFEKLLPTIKCPNCGESLTYNIWPYELPFTPPEDYDIILAELAHRASETPFLLLEYPFCVQVRNALADISAKCSPSTSNDFLFRGLSLSPSRTPSFADFDFPTADRVKEGRYNHAGDSVLYLASSEDVCKAEMRNAADLYIAKFRFPLPLKTLDLMRPHEAENEHSDILSFIVFSALLSAKSQDKGFSRPEYVFSRFIKDCAKYLGFDAIRYPSTRVGTARFNLVIINRELTLGKHAVDSGIVRV
ncbi:MAG TPA: RES family NAD+ phosphorylase [Opitutaceae bacterium]|nr:RES family NAD+ phosphorylase [Opitutaceae bacterium]